MQFWKTKEKEKENESDVDEFNQAIAENNIKTGYVKIYNIQRDAKHRSSTSFVAQRTIREIGNTPLEQFISDDYGGGEFNVKLYKTEKGTGKYIDEFTIRVFGQAMSGGQGDFQQLAMLALRDKFFGESSDKKDDSMNEIMKAYFVKQLEKDDDFSKKLREILEIRELLSPPQMPVVQPETTESKLIDAGAQIFSSFLMSKSGVTPAMLNKSLAEMPLPNQQTVPSNPSNVPQELQGGNGHKPILTKLQAFEILFLNTLKENAQTAEADQLAGMIESIAVDSILWFGETEYHPVVKDFVEGYADMDITKLAKGFNDIVAFAQIPEEKAERIKAMLISVYKDRYQKAGTNASEGVNDNAV